jgi:hypothetical protein
MKPGRDAPLITPRLVLYPSQRGFLTLINQRSFVQDFETEVVDAAFIADPIIGILQDGVGVDLLPVPVGDGSVVDLAYRVQAAEVRHPMREAEVRFHRGAEPGIVQLPQVEITTASGVQRAGIGERFVITRLRGLSGDEGPITVWCRVDSEFVPAGQKFAGDVPEEHVRVFIGPMFRGTVGARDEEEEDEDELEAIAAAHAEAPRSHGRLTVEAMELGRALETGRALAEDEVDADLLIGARTLGTLHLSTAPVPGAKVSARLTESYVSDYELTTSDRGGVADPTVDTVVAGLVATIEEGDVLRLEWSGLVAMSWLDTVLEPGLTVGVDLPEVTIVTVRVPLRMGSQIVPVARTASGGTAAVRVTFSSTD